MDRNTNIGENGNDALEERRIKGTETKEETYSDTFDIKKALWRSKDTKK